MKCIFVFAYYSFKDPVFQSAVLPYLKLVSSSELKFVLLTWERKDFAMDAGEINRIRKELLLLNIVWCKTKWHSGSLKVIKKGFDLLKGIFFSWFLIMKYRATKIYSEGFPGAIIGHYLSKLAGVAHIIHTCEPHADYMLESGVWKAGSWEYKLLKNLETPVARHATSVITPTHAYRKILAERGVENDVLVIPSCINTNHYKFNLEKRQDIRANMGLKNHQIVIVYLGKLGGMYMDEEIFQFFKSILDLRRDKFFFFLFTNERIDRVTEKLRRFNIPLDKVLCKYLGQEEVPGYLSAADIGFCGIRPTPSRRYSSPIKNGEYWACGLPVLIPEGISDDYIHAKEEKIGFSFKETSEINLEILEYLTSLDREIIAARGYSLRGLGNYRNMISHLFTKPGM